MVVPQSAIFEPEEVTAWHTSPCLDGLWAGRADLSEYMIWSSSCQAISTLYPHRHRSEEMGRVGVQQAAGRQPSNVVLML